MAVRNQSVAMPRPSAASPHKSHTHRQVRQEKETETTTAVTKKEVTEERGESDQLKEVNWKKRNRREKPWDNDLIDHWQIEEFKQDDNPLGLFEESSFKTLFPVYREKYLQQVWPTLTQALTRHGIEATLDLEEGSMQVKTSASTFDPYIIVKARDLIKLLARSVPLPQALKILQDDTNCDIIKIGNVVRNKDRFVKRRQRIVGPNGATLKALELLTGCYILVQGQTVACMGPFLGLKTLRRIIEDTMKNVHPVYHIKELMIRRELEKDPTLKNENWNRFLPNFKRKCIQRKKVAKEKKKEKPLFPPEPTPRREDTLIETGEYFLTSTEREANQEKAQQEKSRAKKAESRAKRAKQFETPSATETAKRRRKKALESSTN